MKKFKKLSHLVQEYTAIRYLDDCEYCVHARSVDFAKLELEMERFDMSLRGWLDRAFEEDGVPEDKKKKILQDILCGLSQIHGRGLAHGDLKPGNILVQEEPFFCVLGDLGFVSVARYAKADRTAPTYRDPVVKRSPAHDMYSFGIIFLEIVGSLRLTRQGNYSELPELAAEYISDPSHRKIFTALTSPEHEKRPRADELLNYLFGMEIPVYLPPCPKARKKQLSTRRQDAIEDWMRPAAQMYHINRCRQGYEALVIHLSKHAVPRGDHQLYSAVMMMILSATFGMSGFSPRAVLRTCADAKHPRTHEDVLRALRNLLDDDEVVNGLMLP